MSIHGALKFALTFTAPTVSPVVIGFESTEYSVSDAANYQFVCAEVHSGSVDGRDIEIAYRVTNNGKD